MNYHKPDCQRCKTNINMVELTTCFRCAFCGTKTMKSGQLRLEEFEKNV